MIIPYATDFGKLTAFSETVLSELPWAEDYPDKTAQPHFLSWAPIDTPSPDFHRPEFFGELLLQW